ncbi:uncharacterized protein PV09_02649 [Verruconis gallopava]|uniref:Zn(2)-C6 fungal-type domain-containing protein n=1 Tax=Verruconis gallopava TaxID=253628 RepID=A0A0D2AJC5_9PEZI|nr:uncharacterized protein PV09_02649 [Verruconis gallopava]KIW06993.1 hypothetical protein PV09_02649 [Verruconis gallopava]
MPPPKRIRTRPSRSRGLRTKTGCKTCRKRHLKCDETRPICVYCQRAGRLCEYPDLIGPEQQQSIVEPRNNDEPSFALHSANNTTLNLVDDIAVCIPEQGEKQQLQQPTQQLLEPAFVRSPLTVYSHPSPESDRHALQNQGSYSSANAESLGDAAYNETSPHNISVTSDYSRTGIDDATALWFDLLAGDARLQFEENQGIPPDAQQSELHVDDADFSWKCGVPQSLDPNLGGRPWTSHSTLVLSSHEIRIFEHFVHNVASWIDLLDQCRHYSILVPRLALRNVGLLNAILALSTRHLSLNRHLSDGIVYSRSEALQYYHATLKYVHKAMQHDDYNTSDELLATALIISAYEMLDGGQRDWERHLQGVFRIQRSQVIHGDSGGLRGATWWAWLAQDSWAAFRDKRKPFTFWRPQRVHFKQMDPWTLAARSLFLFAKVVRYCAQKPEHAVDDFSIMTENANILTALLDDWKDSLSIDFDPLPTTADHENVVFKTIVIHPPAFAVSMQLHYAARILLNLHRPLLGGINVFIEQQKHLRTCASYICGIARGLTDGASSILSSQCLFIAGTCINDIQSREEITMLLRTCRARVGWPVQSLEDELKGIWQVY